MEFLLEVYNPETHLIEPSPKIRQTLIQRRACVETAPRARPAFPKHILVIAAIEPVYIQSTYMYSYDAPTLLSSLMRGDIYHRIPHKSSFCITTSSILANV